MDERRRCRLRGRVYFNNGRKSRRCSIRDISYEGARIDLTDPIDRSLHSAEASANACQRAMAPWQKDWVSLLWEWADRHMIAPPRLASPL